MGRETGQVDYLNDFITRNNLKIYWDNDNAMKDFKYTNYSLGQKSCIDHIIMSGCIFDETSLVKQFAICLGVVAILLFNVMEVFSVGGGALLDRLCMVFQGMCVLCL